MEQIKPDWLHLSEELPEPEHYQVQMLEATMGHGDDDFPDTP